MITACPPSSSLELIGKPLLSQGILNLPTSPHFHCHCPRVHDGVIMAQPKKLPTCCPIPLKSILVLLPNGVLKGKLKIFLFKALHCISLHLE